MNENDERRLSMKHVLIRFMFICYLLFLFCPLGAITQERWSKEREERIESLQPSDKIMDTIGIKQGMVVAEIGAGSGRLAVRLAKRVGDSGKVYANDIDRKALEFMRKRCLDEKIGNMIVVEGEETDPQLPRGTMDAVILANTLHMVKDPLPLLKNIIPALKPGGILAVIDADKEKWISRGEGKDLLPKEHFLALLSKAGFEVASEHIFLPLHYFVLLRAKGHASD